MTVHSTTHFQICGACKHAWSTLGSFILDPANRLLGLQVLITNPDFNVLVFEHRCGSSISILTPRLRHLLPDPQPDEALASLLCAEQCIGRCRLLEHMEECDAPCGIALDYKLIPLIQRMKREAKISVKAGAHSG